MTIPWTDKLHNVRADPSGFFAIHLYIPANFGEIASICSLATVPSNDSEHSGVDSNGSRFRYQLIEGMGCAATEHSRVRVLPSVIFMSSRRLRNTGCFDGCAGAGLGVGTVVK